MNRLISFVFVCLGVYLGVARVVVHASETYSLNAIGVIQLSVTANEPYLASVQLIPAGTTGEVYTVSDVLGTNGIPNQTSVKLFDVNSGGYVDESYADGSWQPGTNSLHRGQGFWIVAPTSSVLRMGGYVHDKITAPTTTISLVKGMQLVGMPYPVSGTITGMLDAASAGDMVLRVNGDGTVSTSQTSQTWVPGIGWTPGESAFEVADAWWYRSYSNRTVQTIKPYDYP